MGMTPEEADREWARYLEENNRFGVEKPKRMPRQHTALAAGVKAVMAGPRPNPLRSGFVDLDDKITDFAPGLVTLLAADSGVGKSTIAGQFALHAAAQGHGVVYLNLEMDDAMYGLRIGANFGGVPAKLDMSNDERTKYFTAVEKLAAPSDRIILGNRKEHRTVQAIMKLCAEAKAELAKEGTPLALIVIDHVLEVMVAVKGNDKDGEGKARSDLLKDLAQSCNAHVLALAHITRAASKLGSMPTKNDLAGSAWFDRAADNTMIFHQARNSDGTFANGKAVLAVQKSRWLGPVAIELEYQRGFFFPWRLEADAMLEARRK